MRRDGPASGQVNPAHVITTPGLAPRKQKPGRGRGGLIIIIAGGSQDPMTVHRGNPHGPRIECGRVPAHFRRSVEVGVGSVSYPRFLSASIGARQIRN